MQFALKTAQNECYYHRIRVCLHFNGNRTRYMIFYIQVKGTFEHLRYLAFEGHMEVDYAARRIL